MLLANFIAKKLSGSWNGFIVIEITLWQEVCQILRVCV